MALIIDRRKNTNSRAQENRKRFLQRYKDALKSKVRGISSKSRGITDIPRKRDIVLDEEIGEPRFHKDPNAGDKEFVLPGNKELSEGDLIQKPNKDSSKQKNSGNSDDVMEDDFIFTLSKEEFLDLYFEDMALPDFIKETLWKSIKFIRQRAGYIKEGVPSRLSIKKTFEQAMGRRIATRAILEKEKSTRKPSFLVDEDLRYVYYTHRPKPIRRAVMFCLMDISGSMGAEAKEMSKKFFLFLYLFLFKCYRDVDLVFISHTTSAKEVDEDTFFHSTESGGTIASTAVVKTIEIIKERYDVNTTNIYICQTSDGDNWDNDNDVYLSALKTLDPLIQYYAYMQIDGLWGGNFRFANQNMFGLLESSDLNKEKFNYGRVTHDSHIFPLLQELFKKKTGVSPK